MRQRDLNHAVARSTGEAVTTISRMGFVPLWPEPIDRGPRFIDWDQLEQQRMVTAPHTGGVPRQHKKAQHDNT